MNLNFSLLASVLRSEWDQQSCNLWAIQKRNRICYTNAKLFSKWCLFNGNPDAYRNFWHGESQMNLFSAHICLALGTKFHHWLFYKDKCCVHKNIFFLTPAKLQCAATGHNTSWNLDGETLPNKGLYVENLETGNTPGHQAASAGRGATP